MLHTGWSGFEFWLGQGIFLFCQMFRMGMGVPSGYRVGIKQPGRDVDHSPPSSSEVKNEWSYTSAPPMCFQGVDRGNFNFDLLNM
jgi:hypothetical protein